MTTIDNIMALALNYRLAGSASSDEHESTLRTALTNALAPKLEQEPVAELGVSSFTWLKDRPPAGTKLYAAPQAAQPVREPLNEGEWPKHPSAYVNDRYMGYSKSDLDSYAMQVLAAHGIGENK